MTTNIINETIYLSNSIQNAQTFEDIINLINGAPIIEGLERIEFAAEQLAGQYALDCADDDYEISEQVKYHLEFLSENGAMFNHEIAFEHALKIYQTQENNIE